MSAVTGRPDVTLRRVKLFKIIAAVSCFWFLISPFIWVSVKRAAENATLSRYVKELGRLPMDMSFTDARYETVSEKGEVFSVTAESGGADGYKAQKIFLKNPKIISKNTQDSNNTSQVTAQTGVLDREAKIISLSEKVVIKNKESGASVKTEMMVYDLETGQIKTDGAVKADTKDGVLKAGEGSVDTKNRKIYFKEGVKVIFNPSRRGNAH